VSKKEGSKTSRREQAAWRPGVGCCLGPLTKTTTQYRPCKKIISRVLTSERFGTSVREESITLTTLSDLSKAVSLHAMVKLGGRGDIAPTHS
jgi:hypothetical protein